MNHRLFVKGLVLSTFFLLTISGGVAAATSTPSNILWQDFGANPVFDPAVAAYYPTVVYDDNAFGGNGAARYYKMWYSNGSQVGQAGSDNGKSWTDNGLLPTLTTAHHPQVLYDAGGFGGSGIYYKIWFWDTSVSVYASSIGYADSTDGVNWTNRQNVFGGTGNPGDWNRGSYGPATVIYNATATNSGTDPVDYSYLMYYDGTNGSTEEIGLASSTDGINWNRYGTQPVLPRAGGPWGNTDNWDSSYASPASVINVNGKYHMWYSGGQTANNQGLGHAESDDGINWTKSSDNPIISLGGYGSFQAFGPSGSWHETRNYTAAVIYDPNNFNGHGDSYNFKMWRSGRSAVGNKSIGYAMGSMVIPNPPTTGMNTATILALALVALASGALIIRRGLAIRPIK